MSTPSIDHYNAAIDAVQANQLPEALTAIEASLTEEPNDPQTWQLYHGILTALGQDEKATKAMEKVKELGLSEVDEFLLKAGNAAAEGKLGLAITHYEDALELDDTRGEIYTSYALTLMEEKYTNDALEASAKAVELLPSDAMSQYARGRILRLTGKKEEALEALTKAAQLPNAPVLAIYERGMLLSESGQLPEALKCFDQVLTAHPTDENAATAKAQLIEAIAQSEKGD